MQCTCQMTVGYRAAGSTRYLRKGTRVTIHVGGVGEVNPTTTSVVG